MTLTRAQFKWLKWLDDNGGCATLRANKLVAVESITLTVAAICFLKLILVGAIKAQDQQLVITDYGKRLLQP